MPQQPTYTINEAAALTGLHRNTIRQRIRLGQLDATIQAGKFGDEYRIAHSALVAAGLLAAEGPLGEELPGEPVLDAEFVSPPGSSESQSPAAVAEAESSEGAESVHALATSTVAALGELYQRHEQAMFRLGYLQGELERMKALAETAESLQEDRKSRDQQIEALRADLHDAQSEKDRQIREAESLRQELLRAQERLQEMETLRHDIDQLKSLAGQQERLLQELAAPEKRPWWQFWKG